MAKIVFGGAMSHSPMMNLPIPKDHDKVERFQIAVGQMAGSLREANPTCWLSSARTTFVLFSST
jgi:hypothetical protein